jgi:hypothetical protein
MRIPSILALVLCLMLPASALAQDTRTEEIAAKQKEKAAVLKPYQLTRFERFMSRLEESIVSPPSGWYPAFGSIYPGGGLSLGAGYRHFDKRDAVWDVHGLYSIKAYKNLEVGTRGPWDLRGRFAYDAKAGWLDAPQVAFYGLGMGGGPGRANFHLSQTYASFAALIRPSSWTRLRGEVGYDGFDTKEGRGRAPSIETLYDPSTAPGLGSSPSYIRTEGMAAIDWRTSPSYSAKGGFYGITLANYADTGDDFGFKRLDAEAIQHVPLLRGNWVISLRGRMQTILGDDDVVPYFLLPQLGSGSTLRGYPTGFFRDRHSLLTSAEFRWIPNRLALDMAIFYDAGKVTRDRADLDFSNLESSWGFGTRFHTPTSTILRIEAARPKTGKWRLVVSTGAAF